MKELIFGKSDNGKADKALTNEISVSEGRCSVNIYEVFPQYEIGDPVPDEYDCSQFELSVVLTFYNKKSLIYLMTALKDSLEAWDMADIDTEIKNLKAFREHIKERQEE